MQIFISKVTGETVAVDADPSDTVENVYYRINSEVKGDICDQRLIYAGQTLSYDRTLNDYNVQPGSTIIHLLLLRGGAITVMVKTVGRPDGRGVKNITVHVEPSDTIGKLKKLICDKIEVPVDNQYLLFGTEQLTDNKKQINDYGLRHGSTVHLVFRVRGGGASKDFLT